MRTIAEIKDAVAREHGFDDWEEALNGAVYPSLDKLIYIAMKNYAKQAIEEAAKEAYMVDKNGFQFIVVSDVDGNDYAPDKNAILSVINDLK